MPNPQAAIFEDNSTHFQYLEYKIRPSASFSNLKEQLKKLIQSQNSVHTVYAFCPKTYRKLAGDNCPDNFESFKELEGAEGLVIPRTQYDLFFWVHSSSVSDNLDRVLEIDQAIKSFASNHAINTGFVYHDSRDLTGFVDGSANPKEEKRFTAALIPEGEKGAGGSFVLTQKWQHKLEKIQPSPTRASRKDHWSNQAR